MNQTFTIFLVATAVIWPDVWVAAARFRRWGRLVGCGAAIVQAVILYTLCATLILAGGNGGLFVLYLAPFSLFSLANLGHFLVFRVPIGPYAMLDVVFTNPREALEFLVRQRFSFYCSASAYVTTACWSLWYVCSRSFPAGGVLFHSAICGFTVVFLVLGIFRKLGSMYPFAHMENLVRTGVAFVAIRRSLRLKPAPRHCASRSRNNGNATLIVVLGESVRRQNLSLYGYERDTTPELGRIQDELVVFEDAISPGNTTRSSLKIALSPLTVDEHEAAVLPGSLVYACCEVGVETFWISNQGQSFFLETEVNAIAREVENVCFLPTRLLAASRDAQMLSFVEEALASERPGVVFVHMAGSHYRYECRIDDEFAVYTSDTGYRFSPPHMERVVDNYDNTIRYLDNFLAEIIRLCRKADKPCGLAFFSDHGESLFDDGRSCLHGNPRPLRQEFDVPYIYWLPPECREIATHNGFSLLPGRVSGRAHLQHFYNDAAHILGLPVEPGPDSTDNLGELPTGGRDARRVIVHGKIRDYASLP